MQRRILWVLLVIAAPALPAADKLTADQRIALIRGLTAEYATAKAALPRSKKALKIDTAGSYDKKAWAAAGREFGPAARVGDQVQVSNIDISSDSILFEINGGFKGGRKWYQRIEVGVGGSTAPISRNDSNAPGGTAIVLEFHKPVPPLKADEIKKMLAPVLDFEKRTVTENYLESLPPEIKQAVQDKRAIEGMDRDQVILAVGKPVRKVRETNDGVETEDWIYGTPPGKIVFVSFNGNKVIKVKETYAGLGGAVAPPITPPL
jgi:hypothetical protein